LDCALSCGWLEARRVFTTGEIAAEFAISRNHLTKVIQNLARAGLVPATPIVFEVKDSENGESLNIAGNFFSP
jgi:hypothetical protein